VILAVHTSYLPSTGILLDLVRRLRERLPRSARRHREDGGPSPESALVRALCHDMRGSLACLESALHHLGGDGAGRQEVLAMAQAQAAHLASMLRTAEATGDAPPSGLTSDRLLPDVVAASIEASGLPRRQLDVELSGAAGEVQVGDARLQRILVNLLENAHRHGAGAPVRLQVTAAGGWVELAVTQSGVPAARVVGHLRSVQPPVHVTGLGLWSVQQQVRQLGGRILWEDGDGGLTLRVQLPDR
jgi:signal transduction histidine kinase